MKVYKIYINEKKFKEGGFELHEEDEHGIEYTLEDFFNYERRLLNEMNNREAKPENRARSKTYFLQDMAAFIESVTTEDEDFEEEIEFDIIGDLKRDIETDEIILKALKRIFFNEEMKQVEKEALERISEFDKEEILKDLNFEPDFDR